MPEVEEIVVEVPEESAAPAEQVENPSESAPDEQPEQPEAPKPEGNLQKRLNKLTARNSAIEQEKEYWRQQALNAAKPVTPVEAPKDLPKGEGKPKENDFETAAEYVEALADWMYEQRSKQEREARQQEEQTRTQAELARKVQKDIAAFRDVTPDFDEVMEESNFKTNPIIIRQLQESDYGPAMLYHFAKNPQEADRIADMSDPVKIARELGKIEARVASSTPAKKQEPTTTTPPPLKPVAASRQAVTKLNAIEDDAEYFRQLRANRK